MPLYINLEIPIELWSEEGIGLSVSLFGLPLGKDEYTAKMSKTKFTRVCLEVKVDFGFPKAIQVDLKTRINVVEATYKWKLEVCTKCSKFGHTLNNYPMNLKQLN